MKQFSWIDGDSSSTRKKQSHRQSRLEPFNRDQCSSIRRHYFWQKKVKGIRLQIRSVNSGVRNPPMIPSPSASSAAYQEESTRSSWSQHERLASDRSVRQCTLWLATARAMVSFIQKIKSSPSNYSVLRFFYVCLESLLLHGLQAVDIFAPRLDYSVV